MKIKIAINGLGRVGRCVLRALYENDSCYYDELFSQHIQLVAINELATPEQVLHAVKYDSIHGRFTQTVKLERNALIIGNDVIQLSKANHPSQLNWQNLGIDVLLECSGTFTSAIDAEMYLAQGVQRLMFSQPASREIEKTIVYGVNHHQLSTADRIISSASCTTNAAVPIIDCLNKRFTIERGALTTVHSAMNDQRIIDTYNHDWRKARSVFNSIIPVKTALEEGIHRILPELNNVFTARAIRIPTANVSAINLDIQVKEETDYASVNSLLEEAANNHLRGIMGVSYEPLVSIDFNHDSRSVIVDGHQTQVGKKQLISLFLWFDNEWAYSCRMLDNVIACMRNSPDL